MESISNIAQIVRHELKSGRASPPTMSEAQRIAVNRCVQQFGTFDLFLMSMTKDRQIDAAKNKRAAMFGDAPTMATLCNAYGINAAKTWLIPQITDVSEHFGNALTTIQVGEVCGLIAAEFQYLKVSDVLLFLYWLKVGIYGKIYKLTPYSIMLALRQYVQGRAMERDQMEREQMERENSGKLVGIAALVEYRKNKAKYNIY